MHTPYHQPERMPLPPTKAARSVILRILCSFQACASSNLVPQIWPSPPGVVQAFLGLSRTIHLPSGILAQPPPVSLAAHRPAPSRNASRPSLARLQATPRHVHVPSHIGMPERKSIWGNPSSLA